jgi:hypothetical protein
MQNSVTETIDGGTSRPTAKQSTSCLIPTTTTPTYQVDTTLHITNREPVLDSEIYVPKGSQVSAFVSLGGQPLDDSLTAAAPGTCHKGQNWTHGWDTDREALLKVRIHPGDKEKRDHGPSYLIPAGAKVREYPGFPSIQDPPNVSRQLVYASEAHSQTGNDDSYVIEQPENDGTCVDPVVATAPTIQPSQVFPGARYERSEYWIGEEDCLDYPSRGNITHRGRLCDTDGEIEIGIENGQPSASAFMHRRGGGRQKITRGRITFIPIPKDDEHVKLAHFQRSCKDYDIGGRTPWTAFESIITPPVLKTDISDWLEHQKSIAAGIMAAEDS